MTRAEAYCYQRWLGTSGMAFVLHFRKPVMIRTFCKWGPTHDVPIRFRNLEIWPGQFVEHLARFASHVQVDTTLLEMR